MIVFRQLLDQFGSCGVLRMRNVFGQIWLCPMGIKKLTSPTLSDRRQREKMISQPRLFLLFLVPALCWGNPLPFPFGVGPGDTFTEPNDDLSSVQFSLLRPMMFLNSSVSTVYQNTNGDVTFEMPFEQFVPEVIPSASVPPLAAVYWTDVDTRNGGAEINQLWARVSTSAADLEIATTIINGTGSSFEPDDIFVATWYKVEAFDQRVGPQCTFQLAMAYTEQETWVIFSYEQLEFFSAELNNFTAIGFNDGLGVQGELIGIVDNNETMNDLVFQTNCGIPGTYAYRINQEIEFTTPMPNIAPSSSPSISAIPSSIPTVQPSATPILPPPPCARIGVIMDESFSMGVEQAIFPGIVQQIVSNLEAEGWNVFVCSFGFASFSRDNNPYVKGCSMGYNAMDFEYEKTGSVEDGYEAIRFALDHWSSLGEINGMILDEICLEV